MLSVRIEWLGHFKFLFHLRGGCVTNLQVNLKHASFFVKKTRHNVTIHSKFQVAKALIFLEVLSAHLVKAKRRGKVGNNIIIPYRVMTAYYHTRSIRATIGGGRIQVIVLLCV
ncbi:uncharacterized protein LOC124932141 [Impatiens glandulifera]|uniref:uncharacterized protein LOC124932141 n=1 Tax=Impatiens glandulifera TaxID=253017 RepID=UPI001FB14B34|nr:uncharacterized protein LOC124932141 [Impatiens glandulifera]